MVVREAYIPLRSVYRCTVKMIEIVIYRADLFIIIQNSGREYVKIFVAIELGAIRNSAVAIVLIYRSFSVYMIYKLIQKSGRGIFVRIRESICCTVSIPYFR